MGAARTRRRCLAGVRREPGESDGTGSALRVQKGCGSREVCPLRAADAFQSARGTLSPAIAGLDVLSNKLLEVRNRLHSKILEVIGKQNEALAAQERMAKHLERVGKDVESTAGQVRQVRARGRQRWRRWQSTFGVHDGGSVPLFVRRGE